MFVSQSTGLTQIGKSLTKLHLNLTLVIQYQSLTISLLVTTIRERQQIQALFLRVNDEVVADAEL